MTPSQMLEDRPRYSTKGNHNFYFIRLDSDSQCLVSWQIANGFGPYQINGRSVYAGLVPEDELRRLNVWNQLNSTTQKDSQQVDESPKPIIKPVKPKPIKKQKLKKIDTLTCTKCKKKTKTNRHQVGQRADKKDLNISEFINQYVCKKCTSKSKPKIMTLVCSICKAKQKYPPAMVNNMAKRKGLSVEVLQKEYKCKKCWRKK